MRTNLSGGFSSCSPSSAQHRWSSQEGCLVICHTQLAILYQLNCNTLAAEYRRGVGLSVWCWVAIITGVSPRVNSLTRCATHLPHLHICGKTFNLKRNLKTHMTRSIMISVGSLLPDLLRQPNPHICHIFTVVNLWKTLQMGQKSEITH